MLEYLSYSARKFLSSKPLPTQSLSPNSLIFTNVTGFHIRGLAPAPVTPFTLEDATDYSAIQRLSSWLTSVDKIKRWRIARICTLLTDVMPNDFYQNKARASQNAILAFTIAHLWAPRANRVPYLTITNDQLCSQTLQCDSDSSRNSTAMSVGYIGRYFNIHRDV